MLITLDGAGAALTMVAMVADSEGFKIVSRVSVGLTALTVVSTTAGVVSVWIAPVSVLSSPDAGTGTTVAVWTAVAVAMGTVSVTVVSVSAQTVQTVTVVVKPWGKPLVSVGQTKEVSVVLGAIGTVVVRVYGTVVKPVGQMLMYDVTSAVVV